MATTLENVTIQNRTGTTKEWNDATQALQLGEIGYDTEKHELKIGEGGGKLWKDLPSIGSVDTYDTIIKTQEDFEAWYAKLDDKSYEGKSVLFLDGTYIRSDGLGGLHLPKSLYVIEGIGTVNIKITNFDNANDTNLYGMWYSELPTGMEYSIKNISLSCGLNQTYTKLGVTAFYKCTNLTNCTGYGKGNGSSHGVAFNSCSNLISCIGKTQSGGICDGFSSCSNLVICTGYSEGSGNSFYNCNGLTDCTGCGAQPSDELFNGCTNLKGCTNGAGQSRSIFINCNICSNCRKSETGTTTYIWNGTNTNVDPNTCPEYTGSYNTVIPITDLRGVS